jgi:uncharacterized protein YcaQ
MDNATLSYSSNIFGYVVGIISLIAMALSVFLYRSHLPSYRMRALDELLKDTRAIYEWADKAGLLPTTVFRIMVLAVLTE